MKKLINLLGVLILLSTFMGCLNDTEENSEPKVIVEKEEKVKEITMEKEERVGELTISEDLNLNIEDLQVITFADKKSLDKDGKFSVEANEANNHQILMISDEKSENPVLLGLYNPELKELVVNVESTILSLALLNPYMMTSTKEERDRYLEILRNSNDFQEIIIYLEGLYKESPSEALNYEANPVLYQKITQLSLSSLKELETLKQTNELSLVKREFSEETNPYIMNTTGTSIKIMNPRHVYYACGVYPNDKGLREIVDVKRKTQLVNFNLGTFTSPAETEYNLGNGYYRLKIAKGLDFSAMMNINDPVGRATLYNTAQSILYLVELMIGQEAETDIESLVQFLTFTLGQSSELESALSKGNAAEFTMTFLDIIIENSEQIADWVWQDNENNAGEQYIEALANIMKNLTLATEVLGFVNEQGPFIYDLMFAPKEINYYITQTNGIIESTEENKAPVVVIQADPPAGIVGTEIEFSVAKSYDENLTASSLEFRWDFDGDGIWDTEWEKELVKTYTYTTSGSFEMIVEARDQSFLSGVSSLIVNIGGGAGTATHVKLFRDVLPWDTNATVTVLESLGFTEGIGDLTYEIITSGAINSTELIPGKDLVIISNDQEQNFYNNYAASQIKFTNFVYMGGSLFWGACDEGWKDGSLKDAGVILPGNMEHNELYDNNNYVANANLPLVSAYEGSLYHNYASHEWFSNVPKGATIYLNGSNEEATLVEFNLGAGWIIVAGQPLEHQYTHGGQLETLLPRIVSYFTGIELDINEEENNEGEEELYNINKELKRNNNLRNSGN